MSTKPLVTVAVGPWNASAPEHPLTDFDSVSFSASLRDAPNVQFGGVGYSDAALSIVELGTDVWVYVLGELFARCRVFSMPRAWNDASGGSLITCDAYGYRRVLFFRHMYQAIQWNGIDQTTILWDLVQHTQAQPGGDLGITAGTLEAGTPRNRNEWVAGDNIGERMDQLRDVRDGPWWEIDHLLQLNAGGFDTFPTADVPIVHGTTAEQVEQDRGIGGFANAVLGFGDEAATTMVSEDDPDIATDSRGRWERIHAWPSVTVQSTLAQHTEGALDRDRAVYSTWQCQIAAHRWLTDARYTVGDFVSIAVPAKKRADGTVLEPKKLVDTQITDLAWDYDAATGEFTVALRAEELADAT